MHGFENVDLRLITPVLVAVYPPGATYGPRVLSDFEFVWIIDGECEWECDGAVYPARPGTVILARPGMTDMFRWDVEHQTTHGYFHFEVPDDALGLPPVGSWPLLHQMPAGDVLRPLFRHLSWVTDAQPDGWETVAAVSMRLILSSFVTGAFHARGEEPVGISDVVERTLKYVRESWADGPARSVPLAELAGAASVSPGHLCRVFTREMGRGPIETLRMMRLDRASTLLVRSNLQVQEIAAATGFESAFHFSRRFAELFGMSPRAFRTRYGTGDPPPIMHLARVRRLAAYVWE